MQYYKVFTARTVCRVCRVCGVCKVGMLGICACMPDRVADLILDEWMKEIKLRQGEAKQSEDWYGTQGQCVHKYIIYLY